MSVKVKILIQGYTNADYVGETGEEKTRPTITLIRDGNLVVVVDPGVLESQQLLIDALADEKLTVDDVNIVCITHSHVDHYRNVGMFPKARVLEYYGLWNKESVDDWPEQFSQNIQVLRTPGHDKTGISLMVNTDEGVVAVCGDIFWKENYPRLAADDMYASDPVLLEKSRKQILKMADWIIPGHAGIYRPKKKLIGAMKNTIDAKIIKKENVVLCRKCKMSIEKEGENCICRPWLCYRCCECGLDCDVCSCSIKSRQM